MISEFFFHICSNNMNPSWCIEKPLRPKSSCNVWGGVSLVKEQVQCGQEKNITLSKKRLLYPKENSYCPKLRTFRVSFLCIDNAF